MDDWVVYILLIEGLPLLGFIYYMEYKRRMYLLEKYGRKVEPEASALEKRLIRGIFLLLSGSALICAPNMAGVLGLSWRLTFEMFLIGIIVISAGMAILLSSGILRLKFSQSSDGVYEVKQGVYEVKQGP